MTLRTGTRIEFPGRPAVPAFGFPGAAPERATIARWGKVSGPRGKMPGWHIVKFSTGGKLCCHEDGFRVVDNRAGYRQAA